MPVRPDKGARERDAPAFHAEPSDFCVCATLFPDVDVAGCDRPALLGVEATGDHGEDAAGDGVEYLEGVARRADADVGERRLLHL